MNITLKSIPHSSQRYSTVGDWLVDDVTGDITILVSDMGNEDYNLLVALHELIEVKLCQKRGITQQAVDDFDKAFEAKRKEGNEDEPGDDESAPYRREHFCATNIERIMSAELGVVWDQYDKAVNAL
jgi:hypothetical protein